MDTVTYPSEKVTRFVREHFVPCKVNVKENAGLAGRMRVNWTPTIQCVDADGTVHHTQIGFLPPDDYLAELALARGRAAFNQGKYAEAAVLFRQVVQEHGKSAQAPEAQYWLGVAGYKHAGSPDPLKAAWEALGRNYPGSLWAKKVPFLN